MAKVSKPKFHWDFDALMDLLVQNDKDTERLTEEYAEKLRKKLPDDVPVETIHKFGDDGRPVGLITIMHASGLARQAKDGVMTRTAAEMGMDVHRYPPK